MGLKEFNENYGKIRNILEKYNVPNGVKHQIAVVLARNYDRIRDKDIVVIIDDILDNLDNAFTKNETYRRIEEIVYRHIGKQYNYNMSEEELQRFVDEQIVSELNNIFDRLDELMIEGDRKLILKELSDYLRYHYLSGEENQSSIEKYLDKTKGEDDWRQILKPDVPVIKPRIVKYPPKNWISLIKDDNDMQPRGAPAPTRKSNNHNGLWLLLIFPLMFSLFYNWFFGLILFCSFIPLLFLNNNDK